MHLLTIYKVMTKKKRSFTPRKKGFPHEQEGRGGIVVGISSCQGES